MEGFEKGKLQASSSIRDAVKIINDGKIHIALVVDENDKLIGTITDGDVRRGILKGYSLNDNCKKIMKKDFRSVSISSQKNAFNIMEMEELKQIPVLDKNGKIADVIVKNNQLNNQCSDLPVIIMAGGKGSRLGNLTKTIPKPMLEVAGKPMIDIVIANCKEAGFKKFFISVNYLKDCIIKHLSDGKNFGIEIKYIEENFPMGTGGALSILPTINRPLLVINADVLTKVDLRRLVEFHFHQDSSLTLCSRKIETNVPYGVIMSNGPKVTSIKEKPIIEHNINAGVYLINPEITNNLPKNTKLDMTDIISYSLKKNLNVNLFPIHEYWLDVGVPETFTQANGEW